MKRMSIRWLLSVLLATAIIGLVRLCATKLPYSPMRDDITDAISLPAWLLSRLIYPEGVHTARGAPYWGFVFVLSGVLFYTFPSFVFLSWLIGRSERRHNAQDIVN